MYFNSTASICPHGSMIKNPPANAEDTGLILGLEDPLEKEVATHSSILVWEIPWTEEHGGLPSIGLQRVGYNLATKQQQMLIFQVLHKEKSSFIMVQDEKLEKAMAPHSSTLAWKIPWTEETCGLQSMGSQRVGHD